MNFLTKWLQGLRYVDGAQEVLPRGGMLSELIVNDAGMGRYYELVRHGKVWTTINKAVTIAATHNSPVAANTATPVIGLGNTSPDMAAILLGATFLTTSGTPAGGQVILNQQPGGARIITAAKTGSIFNLDGRTGASPQGSALTPWNGVALGGWLNTPDPVQEQLIIGGASAVAAAGNGGPGNGFIDLGGMSILQPGGLWALMAGSGAGTSWIVNAALFWAELPWDYVKGLGA